MKIYGYACATDNRDDFTVQLNALSAVGCVQYVYDHIAGQLQERTQLVDLINKLEAGDYLIVQQLSRIASSHWRLIEAVQAIEARGAHFKSLADNIDTSTPGGRRFFGTIAALQRFDDDVKAASRQRPRGRNGGRKPLDADVKKRIAEVHADDRLVVADFCKENHISRGTFYKYSNLIAAERLAKKSA